MASEVDVCNMALSHLGNARRVAAIDPPDGTAEADLCATFLPIARSEVLEMADWTFSRKRATLATLATNPSSVWVYAYAKPSDCLVPRRVLTGYTTMLEQDSEQFMLEGDTIYSNVADAVLVYTYPVTDMTKFSPSALATLGYALAAYLAGPIIKGDEGAKASTSFRKAAAQTAAGALAHDAGRSNAEPPHTPSALAARNGLTSSVAGSTDAVYGSGYVVN